MSNELSKPIIGWVPQESWRQLKENNTVVYPTILLKDPERNWGYVKIEINISEEKVTK